MNNFRFARNVCDAICRQFSRFDCEFATLLLTLSDLYFCIDCFISLKALCQNLSYVNIISHGVHLMFCIVSNILVYDFDFWSKCVLDCVVVGIENFPRQIRKLTCDDCLESLSIRGNAPKELLNNSLLQSSSMTPIKSVRKY